MSKTYSHKLKNNTLTFVIPWYGKDLVGGAEMLCRRTAENLHNVGYDVEIFSTCSKSFHSDWSNFYKEGISLVNNIPVQRFRIDDRDSDLFNHLNYKLMNNITISENEEFDYIKNSINSSKMMEQIKKDEDKRIYIFIPYLYGITYYGCLKSPAKSVMIPCFHDESYIYMKCFQDAFTKIRGLIFNSVPEKELAEKVFGSLQCHMVSGTGIDMDFSVEPKRFQNKFNLKNFMLYTGKKDPRKNVPLLIEYYCRYVENNGDRFSLVITGPGQVSIPERFKHNIVSTILERQDLYDAYSAAFLTCQPSLYESFSISIAESWLCKTPVLVHGNCDATKDQCLRSNGGLFFTNYEEFESCINFFLNNPDERKTMGLNGRNYVIENYSWKVILEKYLKFLSQIF